MRFAILTIATLAGFVLAGCTETPASSSSTAPAVSSDSFSVTVSDLRPTVVAGAPFTINVTFTGAKAIASNHLGAHFGGNHTTVPSTSVYTTSCIHETSVTPPGKFQIHCNAPTKPGVYYLRGHGRPSSDATVNWWSDEQTFTVV